MLGGVRLTSTRMADRRAVESLVERDDGVAFAPRGGRGDAAGRGPEVGGDVPGEEWVQEWPARPARVAGRRGRS